jgi:hypothetical protein
MLWRLVLKLLTATSGLQQFPSLWSGLWRAPASWGLQALLLPIEPIVRESCWKATTNHAWSHCWHEGPIGLQFSTIEKSLQEQRRSVPVPWFKHARTMFAAL